MSDTFEKDEILRLSNELLVKILSYLDIRTRVRCESVSRRFRICVNDPLSWTFDTDLDLATDHPVSKEYWFHVNAINGCPLDQTKWHLAVRKLLTIVTVEQLKLKGRSNGNVQHRYQWMQKVLNECWANPGSLRLRRIALCDHQTVYGAEEPCVRSQLINWCLAANRDTLTDLSIRFLSVKPVQPPNDISFNIETMKDCIALRRLELGGTGLNAYLAEQIVHALANKPLEHLSVFDCELHHEYLLAAICNENYSKGKQTLKSLRGKNSHGSGSPPGSGSDFDNLLSAESKKHLTHLDLNTDASIVEMLPALADKYPSLQVLCVQSFTRPARYDTNKLSRYLNQYLSYCSDSKINRQVELSWWLEDRASKEVVLRLLTDSSTQVNEKAAGLCGKQYTVTRGRASLTLNPKPR